MLIFVHAVHRDLRNSVYHIFIPHLHIVLRRSMCEPKQFWIDMCSTSAKKLEFMVLKFVDSGSRWEPRNLDLYTTGSTLWNVARHLITYNEGMPLSAAHVLSNWGPAHLLYVREGNVALYRWELGGEEEI